jgi:hypothetical protein
LLFVVQPVQSSRPLFLHVGNRQHNPTRKKNAPRQARALPCRVKRSAGAVRMKQPARRKLSSCRPSQQPQATSDPPSNPNRVVVKKKRQKHTPLLTYRSNYTCTPPVATQLSFLPQVVPLLNTSSIQASRPSKHSCVLLLAHHIQDRPKYGCTSTPPANQPVNHHAVEDQLIFTHKYLLAKTKVPSIDSPPQQQATSKRSNHAGPDTTPDLRCRQAAKRAAERGSDLECVISVSLTTV